MIQDEIIKINSKYDGEIAEQSKKIKSDYNKLKDDISSIYNKEVETLVDYAFDMVVKGD